MYHAKHGGGDGFAIYQLGMAMPAAAGRRGPRPRDHRNETGGVS